jgi:hypothetical protein
MIYAGERWNAFKNSLTSRYLFGGIKSDASPFEDYKFIDKETCKNFVKSREDPSFLVSWLYYLVRQLIKFLVLRNELVCYL